MQITIKDLQTQKTHDIGENGAVLGRDKRSTDIPVRDESVSKQHARIYLAGGAWLLEDLGSSNGTYFKNKTITEPVELYQGAVFSLAQRQFEVVLVELPEDTRAELDELPGHDTATGEDDDDDAGTPPPAAAPPDDDEAGATTSSRPKREPAVRPAAKAPAKVAEASPRTAPAEPEVEADAAPDKPSVGYFLVAIPKAFAYYLAAVPLLLFNPLGTVRKNIQEQKIPAMSPVQLMAYAIPAFVFVTLLGQIFSFIAMLIAGHFSVGALIPGLPIALAVGIVAGIVAGLVMHPLVRFVVNLLKGRSDERSRTNYAIMIFTVAIVAALPQALGTLLAAIPVPFIVLLSPLIMLVATALALWVSYSWVRAFELVKWMQYVVLVLGALAVLGALGNLVNLTIASVRGLGSGGGSAVAVAEGGAVELSADSQKVLDEAAKTGMSAEQVEQLRQQLLAQQAAIAAAQKAAAAAQETGAKVDGTAAAGDDAKDDAGDAPKGDARDAPKGDARDAPKGDVKDDQAKDNAAADDDTDTGKTEPPTLQLPRPARAPLTNEFLEFTARRDEVEKALKENPVLIRDATVLKLYQALLKRSYDIDGKFQKKRGSKPWEDEINARRRDLALFEGTRKLVDNLYRRIYGD